MLHAMDETGYCHGCSQTKFEFEKLTRSLGFATAFCYIDARRFAFWLPGIQHIFVPKLQTRQTPELGRLFLFGKPEAMSIWAMVLVPQSAFEVARTCSFINRLLAASVTVRLRCVVAVVPLGRTCDRQGMPHARAAGFRASM